MMASARSLPSGAAAEIDLALRLPWRRHVGPLQRASAAQSAGQGTAGGWLARLQADARRLDEESAVKEATAAGDGAAQKEFSNRF